MDLLNVNFVLVSLCCLEQLGSYEQFNLLCYVFYYVNAVGVLLCTLKIRAGDIAVFMHVVRCVLLLSLMLELKYFDEQYSRNQHIYNMVHDT